MRFLDSAICCCHRTLKPFRRTFAFAENRLNKPSSTEDFSRKRFRGISYSGVQNRMDKPKSPFRER
jgi:hypothetical protein